MGSPKLSETKSSLQDNVDISHNPALDDGHFSKSEVLDKDSDNFKSISMDDFGPDIKNAFADAAAKSHSFLHSKKIAHESHKEDDVHKLKFSVFTWLIVAAFLAFLVVVLVVAVSLLKSKRGSKDKFSSESG